MEKMWCGIASNPTLKSPAWFHTLTLLNEELWPGNVKWNKLFHYLIQDKMEQTCFPGFTGFKYKHADDSWHAVIIITCLWRLHSHLHSSQNNVRVLSNFWSEISGHCPCTRELFCKANASTTQKQTNNFIFVINWIQK